MEQNTVSGNIRAVVINYAGVEDSDTKTPRGLCLTATAAVSTLVPTHWKQFPGTFHK